MFFFTGAALWLQILMVVAALPLVCLLLGVLVCFFDPTAMGTFERARWYQVPLGLMMLGAFVAAVLALIGGVTLALLWLLAFIGLYDPIIAFVLALAVVLGSIAWFGEEFSSEVKRRKKVQDNKKRRDS